MSEKEVVKKITKNTKQSAVKNIKKTASVTKKATTVKKVTPVVKKTAVVATKKVTPVVKKTTAVVKKTTTKKIANKKVVSVTLKKSINGRIASHRATLVGLGLKKINHTVTLEDTPCVRGMINKVAYLLKIES